MSQQNNYLPRGSALEWDMTKLTQEQLQYEYDLAYEILHGIYIDGELIIEGMLNIEPNGPMYDEALHVWKLRLSRAQEELVDRQILS